MKYALAIASAAALPVAAAAALTIVAAAALSADVVPARIGDRHFCPGLLHAKGKRVWSRERRSHSGESHEPKVDCVREKGDCIGSARLSAV
jgi:hypothetical protein